MASYPLSLRWVRVGVRVIPPIPIPFEESGEGPLTLSAVEGSSEGRPTTAIPSRKPTPNQAPLHCHSEAPRGI